MNAIQTNQNEIGESGKGLLSGQSEKRSSTRIQIEDRGDQIVAWKNGEVIGMSQAGEKAKRFEFIKNLVEEVLK